MRRTLPTFLIIGVAKAGTTSVYAYLKEHPQIYMSPIKETNYFAYQGKDTKTFLGKKPYNEFPVTTMEQYLALFEHAADKVAIGEASPLYFESPVAAARIKRTLPEAKLIVILRNPVERAFSDYMMGLSSGRGTWVMEEAFRENGHMVQVGFYYEKLKRYFDCFARERIKVYLYDDLKTDPLRTMKNMFCDVGVDPSFEPNTSVRYNVGGAPKNRTLNTMLVKGAQNRILKSVAPQFVVNYFQDMWRKNLSNEVTLPEDLRRKLTNLYSQDILQTQELIKKDLTHWLELVTKVFLFLIVNCASYMDSDASMLLT